MSYCVNCGVELADAAKKCPLCDTPVINPNILNTDKAEPPFPKKIVLPKGARTRYGAIIASFLILLPNFVCVITNLLLTPHRLWSVYVVASSAIAWFLFVFPFLMKRKHIYLILAVDAAATVIYIFLFYYYNSAKTGWFLSLAVPITAGVFLTIGILSAYFGKKKNLIKSIIAILTALISLNIFICLIVNIYIKSVIVTYITMIFAVSCLILLIIFIIANKNYRFRAWLSRKFFF